MIMIRRTYTPKPGEGGKLMRVVRQIGPATSGAGFPPLAIYRQALGPHGTIVTEQTWSSASEYDSSREQVRQTKDITQLFEQVYPLLASTHVTEMYDVIE